MENNKFDKCLICNSIHLEDLIGYEKNYLQKCKECDFVFCSQKPSHEELIQHYNQYTRGGEISSITIKRYQELLDIFEPYRKNNNIIDIGCGDGYFLVEAKKRGWNVYGTEFTDEAVDNCRKNGINIHQGKLDSNNYSKEFFDIITSFEVIEHINNPKEELVEVIKILRTGGGFYITTPNFNALSRYYYKGDWGVIEYPEHLSYYTSKTLNYMLTSFGFKKKLVETTGISFNRVASNGDEKLPINYKSKNESLREKTESKVLFRWIKISVNFILNITKTGEALKVLYIKE